MVEYRISEEQLLQKIGTMAIMMDIQAAQAQEKIKALEDTIAELQSKKAE